MSFGLINLNLNSSFTTKELCDLGQDLSYSSLSVFICKMGMTTLTA